MPLNKFAPWGPLPSRASPRPGVATILRRGLVTGPSVDQLRADLADVEQQLAGLDERFGIASATIGELSRWQTSIAAEVVLIDALEQRLETHGTSIDERLMRLAEKADLLERRVAELEPQPKSLDERLTQLQAQLDSLALQCSESPTAKPTSAAQTQGPAKKASRHK